MRDARWVQRNADVIEECLRVLEEKDHEQSGERRTEEESYRLKEAIAEEVLHRMLNGIDKAKERKTQKAQKRA